MIRTKQILHEKTYEKEINKNEPKPTYLKNILWAFFVGGAICTIGQLFMNLYLSYGLDKDNAGTLTSITMVFLGALFTGIGWYDILGKRAGAGSIVPITGFANSIVSPAMEFKREGLVFGVAAKMFVIAGPVIVYGVTSSFIVGLIYFFIK